MQQIFRAGEEPALFVTISRSANRGGVCYNKPEREAWHCLL